MNAPRIRILTVDDHPLIRDGIAALLLQSRDMELAGEAASGLEAIEQFRLLRPDVTLMDLQMDGMSGIDTISAVRREFPDARIVVLTTYAGDMLAQRALKAGAQAYLLKNRVRKDLLDTIRAVHAGHRRIDAEVAAQLASHTYDDLLSSRELDVLALIATGHSNKSIAIELAISEGTVKTHVKSILSKLSAVDRTHAAMLAIERGVIGV